MPPKLILASASEARARMLHSAGVDCEIAPVRIDETALRASLQAEAAHPRDIADVLAEAKARKASRNADDALVLGSDQILSLDKATFGKPENRAAAAKQLATLSGQRHSLFSAAVIYENSEPVWRHLGVAHLTMRTLREDEIDAYLDKAWPAIAGSVGCYHLEGLGVQLFDRVEGDFFTIQGLPLLPLLGYLRIRGVI